MKMELIASLLHLPEIIFLDEPTIGLDIVAQDAIRTFLREYNKRYKATIILTSHYIKDIESLCERIIIIDKGKILFDGRKDEIIYKFCKYEVLRITFRSAIPEEIESVGEIILKNEKKIDLKVLVEDRHSISSFISERFDIDKIRIIEPPLEDVIKEIFINAKISENHK